MRTTLLFPVAVTVVLAVFLFACEPPPLDMNATLSIHQLLADDIQAELDSLETTPGTENDAIETDVPITEIEISKEREVLEEQMKYERTNATYINEQLCNGIPNCPPRALSRIGEPCGKGKCYDLSLFKRWACRFELQLKVSIYDAQNNLVFESLPGNEKEKYEGNSGIRIITLPENLAAGQLYRIDFQEGGRQRSTFASF
ncbi:MAG TPA: hypothetical protein PK198_04385 [Saprospiraceae bacterium]|nr:hypothetical protein [Saprospiraceae bacterium]HRK82639.1 hypothetical protein [Saprospiraceae bacterium]